MVADGFVAFESFIMVILPFENTRSHRKDGKLYDNIR